MIILLSLISFILYTLAAAHGSVANGIKMVGNAFQIHVDGRYMVGVNPHAMVVDGPVGGKPAVTLNQFVTKRQMNTAISAGAGGAKTCRRVTQGGTL